ncbi:translation initiation factor IF-2 [Candidatus Giovannonibacteria bacterium]|nr:translation initiation factor IF-2 [Candidatus Giovannonibacteria bacterium]
MEKNLVKENNKILTKRPPVIAVLGHIDHGKTSLLDRIRDTKIASKETGGITQHIGAYVITLKDSKNIEHEITFIDTPGHEAFSKMRSRGAGVADIALLVVAADDGVKPQTEESLKAINEAKIPFIVVLNKIDKETADSARVKKELGEKGVLIEEWGGKVPVLPVSAKTGEGIEKLLEMILLLSDLEELTTDLSKKASGVVIESHLDPKRGNAATLLICEGELSKGDFILAGGAYLKIKILENFEGKNIERARASNPVRVVGFEHIPSVGAVFNTFPTQKDIEFALKNFPEISALPAQISGEGAKAIPVILRADTAGSLEALQSELKKFEIPEATINYLRSEVGNITEDDIKLAAGGKETIIIGFRVKAEKSALDLAERFMVTVKTFDLIYEMGDWLQGEIEKRLPEEKQKKVLGRARILKIFKKDGSKQIVGGRVESGLITEGKRITLLRRDFPLGEGRILELQSGKMRAREVSEGSEFGVLAEIAFEIAPGDVLEIFEEEIKKVQFNLR